MVKASQDNQVFDFAPEILGSGSERALVLFHCD